MESQDLQVVLREKNDVDRRHTSFFRTSHLPYIDNAEEPIVVKEQAQMHWPPPPADDGKPKIRYYSVGYSTKHIKCPLCHKRTEVEHLKMGSLVTSVAALLSCLSCCFPAFILAPVICCFSKQCRHSRAFCTQCGGHLGFYNRPT